MRLPALFGSAGEHLNAGARGLGEVERLPVEIVAAKDDRVVHRTGVKQLERLRQIGAKAPLPHASSGLPSPLMKPIPASISAFCAGDSGGNSKPWAAAISRINSASPPDEVMTAMRRPTG